MGTDREWGEHRAGCLGWQEREQDGTWHPGCSSCSQHLKIPLGIPRGCYHREGAFLPKDQVDKLARVQGYALMWGSTHRAEGCRRLSGRTIPVMPPRSGTGRDLASALPLA